MNKILDTKNIELFLYINSHHNTFWDQVMYLLSSTNIWIPLYIYIIYIFYKIYKSKSWICILTAIIMITLSDQISTYFKYVTKVLRPSHEIYLKNIVHLSKAGPGGLYGYVSSHASNFFTFTLFLTILLPKKYNEFKVALFICSILVSYSRIYNGVHYPMDVLRGAILGAIIGTVFGLILILNKYLNSKLTNQ